MARYGDLLDDTVGRQRIAEQGIDEEFLEPLVDMMRDVFIAKSDERLMPVDRR